jgi:hypothetical protein
MIAGATVHLILLKGGKKLLLRTWKEKYCDQIKDMILSLLKGDVPEGTARIESSQNTQVWKSDQGGTTVYIKFFGSRGVRDRLRLRKSRAYRSVEGSKILLEAGFLVPDVVAQGEVLKGIVIYESFLVTRGVDKSDNIYDYISRFFVPGLRGAELQRKHAEIRQMGQLIGSMHKKGIFHGDLRPGNVLIQRDSGEITCFFIDNERNKRFPGGIPSKMREKNLVQMNMITLPGISFTDRLRFFNAYLAENPELAAGAGELMKRVFLTTRKRLEKKYPGIWSGAGIDKGITSH